MSRETNEPREVASPDTGARRDEAERLETLLQQLEDHIARLDEGLPVDETPPSRLQEQAISARLHRLRALQAPFLDLGTSRLRWIARLGNLPIWPWGRKQARFNREILLALEELHARSTDALRAADALPRLEARVARMEGRLRRAVAERHSLPGPGDRHDDATASQR